jgi:hypothetical protein
MNSHAPIKLSMKESNIRAGEVLNLFVRQPFTESKSDDKSLIQSVMDLIADIGSEMPAAKLNLLTGSQAESATTFKSAFETATGIAFTPSAFRKHRLTLLDRSDAMVVVRTSLSESSAFEVAYSVLRNPERPILFAVHETCPFRTTLLQDLQDLTPATYIEFAEAGDLRQSLAAFFTKVIAEKGTKRFSVRNLVVIVDRDILDCVETFMGSRQEFNSVSPISENSLFARASADATQVCALLDKNFPAHAFVVVDATTNEISWAKIPRTTGLNVAQNWALS